MKKIDNLKQFLFEKKLINNAASQLQMAVTNGHIEAITTSNLVLFYHYTLHLTFDNYQFPFEELMQAIVSWMTNNQSDSMLNPESRKTSIKFDVQDITECHCKINIKLKLSERILTQNINEALQSQIIKDKILDEDLLN